MPDKISAEHKRYSHCKSLKISAQGFTLMELMIAMAIFSIGVLSVVSLQISSVNQNTNSRKFNEAAAFAQGRIDTLLSLPINSVVLAATPPPAPGVNPIQISGYSIQTNIINNAVDLDGLPPANDAMIVEIVVFDPGGVERSRIRFLKARDV